MSDSEANKAIVRRYFEMFNSGDLGQLACPIESATGRCAIHTGDVWRMETHLIARAGDEVVVDRQEVKEFPRDLN
ncbi:hypothetical protein [Mesorhizobium sp. B4-1-1]|uniref:hypothetical protein n=1 Tax=Mesorhizobium sp. B4-1-1 TaxID=2589890 RepID=UPI00112DEC63|nr:hypothetical protein [Mesorhizobium sp. B4-1-1]TPI22407.1 hypothetical protein FJW10_02955 [Mesorhizobium sp. B4-1-1]